jgi:hypothetical protein
LDESASSVLRVEEEGAWDEGFSELGKGGQDLG